MLILIVSDIDIRINFLVHTWPILQTQQIATKATLHATTNELKAKQR